MSGKIFHIRAMRIWYYNIAGENHLYPQELFEIIQEKIGE